MIIKTADKADDAAKMVTEASEKTEVAEMKLGEARGRDRDVVEVFDKVEGEIERGAERTEIGCVCVSSESWLYGTGVVPHAKTCWVSAAPSCRLCHRCVAFLGLPPCLLNRLIFLCVRRRPRPRQRPFRAKSANCGSAWTLRKEVSDQESYLYCILDVHKKCPAIV